MSRAIEMQSTTQQHQQTSQDLLDEKLRERIRQRAYQLYEARGAEPGRELDDWTKAEAELAGPMKVTRAA